jgi:hypothetical protein
LLITSFSILSVSVCVSLPARWLSCRQHIVGSFLKIHSVSLNLLIGELRPFTCRVIIESYVLMSFFFILEVFLFMELIIFGTFLVIECLPSKHEALSPNPSSLLPTPPKKNLSWQSSLSDSFLPLEPLCQSKWFFPKSHFFIYSSNKTYSFPCPCACVYLYSSLVCNILLGIFCNASCGHELF